MTANSWFMILRLCSIQWFSNSGMNISSDGIYYVSPSERDLNIEKAFAAYYLSLAIKAIYLQAHLSERIPPSNEFQGQNQWLWRHKANDVYLLFILLLLL